MNISSPKMTKPLIVAFATISSFSMSLNAQTSDYLAITDTIQETVGIDRNSPTASGDDLDNVTTWTSGVVGVFEVNDGDYYLQVSATNPTGTLTSGSASMMAIQTSNSQGYTDSRSLSMHIIPVDTAGDSAAGAWTLDLNFSYFTDAALTQAATDINLGLTSFDLDFSQAIGFSTGFDTAQTSLYANSELTRSTINGYDTASSLASHNSSLGDAKYAVRTGGSGSSYDMRLSSDVGRSLFFFEFRNPSEVVPEPSSTLLLGLGLVSVLTRRKR